MRKGKLNIDLFGSNFLLSRFLDAIGWQFFVFEKITLLRFID